MSSLFDDEVLLLRPLTEHMNSAAIEQHLAATPGAFRDPLDASTWYLAMHPQYVNELRQKRLENPTRYLPDPRVVVSPDDVVVVPGVSGRGRKFVHWLLSQGPCELTVRGQAIGRVTSPSDIYAENDWDDPDAYLDPTETPPRTGTVIELRRYHEVNGSLSEYVAVHDSGVMSYEQRYPVEDPAKTYRRMSPELLARWLELIKPLPITGDAPGPDGEFIDPVFLNVEIPTDIIGAPKIDAARPPEHYRELLSLMNAWAAALRANRAAMPPGLLPYP